jgi:hypothetical protein
MEYGAIDLHTKESESRIVTGDRAVVFERRIATTRARLTDVFGSRAPLRVLLESGTGSECRAASREHGVLCENSADGGSPETACQGHHPIS